MLINAMAVLVPTKMIYLEKERVWFAVSIKDCHNSNVAVFSDVNHVELHWKSIMDQD